MAARNTDRYTSRPRRERAKPDEGVYALERGIYRVRHSKVGDGWYAHRMQVSRHGRIECAYLGQRFHLTDKAVLLPVDPDYPVPCSRYPQYADGTHAIAGEILCTSCMTEHIRKVS